MITCTFEVMLLPGTQCSLKSVLRREINSYKELVYALLDIKRIGFKSYIFVCIVLKYIKLFRQ